MVFIGYKLYCCYLKNACLLSVWECTREDKHRNCSVKEGDCTFLRMTKKKRTFVVEEKQLTLT